MVVSALLSLLFAPLIVLLNAIPDVDVPSFLNGGDCVTPCSGTVQGAALDVGLVVGGMNNWVPVSDALNVAELVVGFLLFTTAVRMVRMIVSLVTGGGGSIS